MAADDKKQKINITINEKLNELLEKEMEKEGIKKSKIVEKALKYLLIRVWKPWLTMRKEPCKQPQNIKLQLAPCQNPPNNIVTNKLRFRRTVPLRLPPRGK